MGIVSNLFAVLAALLLPIGVAIWLSVKKKGYLKPVLLGALTFFVFQVVTRIPLLEIIGNTVWFSIISTTQPILYALFLGGTAALFEEGGRWIVMRLFMKNRHRLDDGIAFGIGHGGIEAVLLVGINAVMLLILNEYSVSSQQMFAGVERISTMILHIAWSVMVLKSVALKKPSWLLLAFIQHTVIDTAAVLMQQAGVSTLIIEAVIGIFALVMLGYVFLEHKKYKGAAIQ